MNTLIDFETAKLLKEKGFKQEHSKEYYLKNGLLTSMPFTDYINGKTVGAVPTIAEVVMWLYYQHGVWITPVPITKNKWYWEILHSYEDKKGWTLKNDSNEFNSPREASFKAISYTLNNLITKTK